MNKLNFKRKNNEIQADWEEEYKRLGNNYAKRAAWLVVLTFPSIILANYHLLKPENLPSYTLAYLTPTIVVGLGILVRRFYNYKHEFLVALIFGSVFFASAFRTDENDLLIYLIINSVSFIASSVQMIVVPILNSYFITYILVVHPLIAYFHYEENIAVYFGQHGGLVMLVLSFVFSGVNSLRYQILKKNFLTSLALKNSYELLSQKTKIIEENAQKLREQNNDITASINYAKKIQEAILPTLDTIKHSVPDSFILFRPRDIVSGDFYWFANLKEFTGRDEVIFAAVDCTGHGVPGAFMSMIGNTFLNQLVNEYRMFNPADILNELHIKVQEALKQKESQTWDGMDIALIYLDRKAQKLQFAGAKNPLCFIQDGEFKIIKGNKFPVGGFYREGKQFKSAEISLNGSEVFYIFTDGFQDQFGGKKGKKLTVGRFHKMLQDIHHLPFDLQKKKLEGFLAEWQGEEPQIDDILVIGFKP